jgi:hypothetical protein
MNDLKTIHNKQKIKKNKKLKINNTKCDDNPTNPTNPTNQTRVITIDHSNTNNTNTNSIDADADQIHKNKLNFALKESVKKNKWFYLTLFVCFFMFKESSPQNTSYILLIVSYIFVLILGHITHRISHNINFTDMYNKFKKNNINPRIDNYILKFCSFLDFHSITHHDTTINKKPVNILYEFFNNVITQGGAVIIFVKLVDYFIDYRVILLWAFMYATTHNINYVYLKPSTHRDHHIDDSTNYGIDIADIIFDTKYNLDDIETHNHVSINLIIITLIIIYFYKWWN